MRSRKVRAVELAELYLDRLERIGPRYNAVVTVMRDHALGQARRADAEIAAGRWRGPLHGIPYGAKDLLATAGAPTTWGAAPYRAALRLRCHGDPKARGVGRRPLRQARHDRAGGRHGLSSAQRVLHGPVHQSVGCRCVERWVF